MFCRYDEIQDPRRRNAWENRIRHTKEEPSVNILSVWGYDYVLDTFFGLLMSSRFVGHDYLLWFMFLASYPKFDLRA